MTDVRSTVDRRTELLRAAREVLAEKGLDAAKISEIVARAGVAQGTFYLYFPSKLSLVSALAEDMNTQMLASIRAALDGADTLSAGIDAAIAAAFRELERYRDILGILHSRVGIAEGHAEIQRLDKPFQDFVAGTIRRAQEAGQIAPTLHPEIAAQLVIGLIEHAGHACFIYSTQAPTAMYVAEVARFVRGALGVEDTAEQRRHMR